MEQQSAEAKSARLLDLYARFISGQTLNKQDLASEYGVTTRSIQRDMESLRCFLMEKGLSQEIIYDRRHGGYRMVSSVPSGLTNSEILAVCKILLESRSMRRDEMLPILDKLVDCAVPPEQRQAVKLLIGNEKLHYIEPHHGKSILNGLWEIGQAVKEQRVMEIEYERMKAPKLVTRRVQPVGIMFSEYYFYLTAFLENKDIQFSDFFEDMLFTPGTITYPFLECKISDDNGNEIAPTAVLPVGLHNFNYNSFYYRVREMTPPYMACFNKANYSLKVDPRHIDDDYVILHEMIHMHEFVLEIYPTYYHDAIFAFWRSCCSTQTPLCVIARTASSLRILRRTLCVLKRLFSTSCRLENWQRHL